MPDIMKVIIWQLCLMRFNLSKRSTNCVDTMTRGAGCEPLAPWLGT